MQLVWPRKTGQYRCFALSRAVCLICHVYQMSQTTAGWQYDPKTNKSTLASSQGCSADHPDSVNPADVWVSCTIHQGGYLPVSQGNTNNLLKWPKHQTTSVNVQFSWYPWHHTREMATLEGNHQVQRWCQNTVIRG